MKRRLLRLVILSAVALALGAIGIVSALALSGNQGAQPELAVNNAAAPKLPPDFDTDGDGVADHVDNCPDVANSGQKDADTDGLGDVCDPDDADGNMDTDGDFVNNDIENALGSNPLNDQKRPEHFAMMTGTNDPCTDRLDNDADGNVDVADPGCVEPDLITAGFPANGGPDIFPSRMDIIGPDGLETTLRGPTVIDRRGRADADSDGMADIKVEIVAMQLRSDGGTLQLGTLQVVESKVNASLGQVESLQPESDFPATSFFDVFAELQSCQPQGPCERGRLLQDQMTNRGIHCLPPVFPDCHDQVPEQVCYKNPSNTITHCPEWPTPPDGDEGKPILKYVAKFDCGEQPSTSPPFLESVEPGNYATKLVIHNPQGITVTLEKKASEGLRNPEFGPIGNFKTVTLPPDATTEVDCRDILQLLEQTIPPPGTTLTFTNGVVVILSEKKLDVIANYTQEVAKEQIEFTIRPPDDAPPEMLALARKRLKLVTLVHQGVIISEESEIREALKQQFPAEVVDRTTIVIRGVDLGVGSSIDVQEIRPQKCLLMDPPDLPQGQLKCEVDG